MSDQKWSKITLGFTIGLSSYGVVKWIRKEKWTFKGAAGSALTGGIGFPLAEPVLRKAINALKNLPPPAPQIPRENEASAHTSFSDHSQNVREMLIEIREKVERMKEESLIKLPPAPDDKWQSILIPGSVILIIGKRGSGKTALGYFLLQKLHDRTSCYVVNLPKTVQHLLPSWLGVVPNLEETPTDSVLLLDEAALEFPARMSAREKNQRLLEIISLARQRNQIIIFIAQEASYLDITILRGLSTLIIKEPAPLQTKLERPEVKEFIERAQTAFDRTNEDKRKWAYVAISPSGYQGMLRTPKPSFFCSELSSCYGSPHQKTQAKEPQTLSKEDKKRKAYEWYLKDHLSVREIARRLGVSKSTAWNWIQEEKGKRQQKAEVLDWALSEFGQIGRN